MTSKKISRRQLLKDSAIAAIGTSLFMSAPLKAFANSTKNTLTKVVLIRNQDVLNAEGKLQPEVLNKMIDDAIVNLSGKSNSNDAWASFIKPDDILGIKTNVWNYLSTPPSLEQHIKAQAINIGVNSDNISVKDRGILRDPVFKKATALINLRPMRTHAWSGVGSLLKNYIMFVDTPSAYHGDSCADLAKIWKLPHVINKTRLNILVMLTPLFHGVGPHHFNKKFTWQYKGIIVGTDPVAVDSVGVRILQAKRKDFFNEDNPLNPPAKHIMLADTRHNLGTANPEKINLVKLGWQKDLLV